MSLASTDPSEIRRARLRDLVKTIDREISRMPTESISTAGLLESWAELVALLDLGIAPALRKCPRCGAVGMAAATRCGHCWTHFDPAAPAAE